MLGFTSAVVLQTLILSTSALPYESSYRTAIAEGKPMLILVSADWCPACRIMKNETLASLDKLGGLAAVSYSIVDVDHQSPLAQRLMRGNSIPQLILFQPNPQGWRRQQLTGAQNTAQVKEFINLASGSAIGE